MILNCVEFFFVELHYLYLRKREIVEVFIGLMSDWRVPAAYSYSSFEFHVLILFLFAVMHCMGTMIGLFSLALSTKFH